MYLVSCVYDLCTYHERLSLPLMISNGHAERERRIRRTPAQAASLGDHRWSVFELLSYQRRHVRKERRCAGGGLRRRPA